MPDPAITRRRLLVAGGAGAVERRGLERRQSRAKARFHRVRRKARGEVLGWCGASHHAARG